MQPDLGEIENKGYIDRLVSYGKKAFVLQPYSSVQTAGKCRRLLPHVEHNSTNQKVIQLLLCGSLSLSRNPDNSPIVFFFSFIEEMFNFYNVAGVPFSHQVCIFCVILWTDISVQ